MEKTYYPKESELTHDWYHVDANGQNLGRLATQIAVLLIGKHKPTFTPGVDVGDFVVVTNCERIVVTGNKMLEKMYYRHTGYPGGLKEMNLRDMLQRKPEEVIRKAVWGMLPHNKHGRKLLKKLKIYAGPEHPHAAQDPKAYELD